VVLDVLLDDGARGLRARERERPGGEALSHLVVADQVGRGDRDARNEDRNGRRDECDAPRETPATGRSRSSRSSTPSLVRAARRLS
jgi:hypothetical protein